MVCICVPVCVYECWHMCGYDCVLSEFGFVCVVCVDVWPCVLVYWSVFVYVCVYSYVSGVNVYVFVYGCHWYCWSLSHCLYMYECV